MSPVFILSACLIGEKCAYDGLGRISDKAVSLKAKYDCLPLCPELLGGLGCPREQAEIVGGTGIDVLSGGARVVSVQGTDVTRSFILGALKTLSIARSCGASSAVMRSNSPSCGKYRVYDGTFTGTLKEGMGVTSALLSLEGISVLSETEIDDVFRE
ncbi:MAG: DUF523 domain-containing protein [Candidatus Omnitrophica bacterium]|jgi:uncharacterized protein YbbK (DUF523 family)|nr:DUF523 domain-containing protein [Candidatus Omnitrophota bacterium]MDD4012718.1 DUF523 domain-containing protein [Candidatus Omnitrophota bacterium]